MNNSSILIQLLHFTSGINFIVLLIASIVLFFKNKYRFQKLFSLTFLLWSFAFCNIFFYNYKDFPNTPYFQNILIHILDFYIIGLMIISLLYLLHHKSSSLKYTYLILLPFFLFSFIFIITKSLFIYTLLQYFTGALCLIMYVYIEYKISKHSQEIKSCHSNLDTIHLKWTAYILRICLVIVALFLFLRFNFSALIDLIYNILILPLIIYISIKILKQEVPQTTNITNNEELKKAIPLYQSSDISELIYKNQYYLTEDLNLNMLANLIGTNRTYLSRIINQELEINFYDYINTFRIKHAEELLKSPDCSLNLESIAYESGFRSYSTFNRFFKKKHNITPGNFREKYLITES